MSDWGNYRDKMPPNNSGDLLKLEDGKPVKVRVIGEPWVFQSEYKGNPSTRFALAIYNQDSKAAQILMLPKTPFGQIMDLATNEEWGDPEMYDITITRTGTGKETTYSITPSPKRVALEKIVKELVEGIDLKIVLERLPSVNFAILLKDANDNTYKQPEGDNKQKGVQPVDAKEDVVIEDIPDGEVSLDDISF